MNFGTHINIASVCAGSATEKLVAIAKMFENRQTIFRLLWL